MEPMEEVVYEVPKHEVWAMFAAATLGYAPCLDHGGDPVGAKARYAASVADRMLVEFDARFPNTLDPALSPETTISRRANARHQIEPGRRRG